jgi:hypothetical protein
MTRGAARFLGSVALSDCRPGNTSGLGCGSSQGDPIGRQPPTWKGVWRDAKGKSWYVEACREHAPKSAGARSSDREAIQRSGTDRAFKARYGLRSPHADADADPKHAGLFAG